MNCKPGDLAYYKGPKNARAVSDALRAHGFSALGRNKGRIVRCIKATRPRFAVIGEIDSWVIDPPLIGADGQPANECPDEWLIPLRDSNAPDETLSWAGLPVKEQTNA